MITILIPHKSALAIPKLSIPPTTESRAERKQNEEEEQRFYSVLMLEPKSQTENRSDRLDLSSQGV